MFVRIWSDCQCADLVQKLRDNFPTNVFITIGSILRKSGWLSAKVGGMLYKLELKG